MTTEMPRSTDARWYEPPPPRDWKTNPSALQRIESADKLRKSLLESATKAIGGVPVRRNIQTESRDMNRSFESEISKSLASLPTTPRALRSSHTGSAIDVMDNSRTVQPSFSRQMSASMRGSAMDLSSTFVLRNRYRNQDDVKQILVNTPPSRPRSSSMTKYEPLPAIKHSAGSVRRRATYTSNSSNSIQNPAPLIRSRTFDVIETNLDHLPVVDDDCDYTSFSDSSDGQDDTSESSSESEVMMPPKATTQFLADNDFMPDTADSGVVSASSYNSETTQSMSVTKGNKNKNTQRENIFECINSAMPVQTVTVTIEGKLLSEYISQIKMGAIRSRPGTQYGRDFPCSDSPSSSESLASPDGFNNRIINCDDGMEDDIIVYIKMPDDTLMLASSPRGRSLRELLTIVKGTNINGHCVVISRKGLNLSDLNKSLYELGIGDNTTLHLITE